ncbi:Gfo/Idh/MocA family protein [Allofournierella sp.]|uniref:Gfo/Idh/MocA family protein n=1 Tax=Allofournierella sp. TaxID=1940256 RepID=UPI003AB5F5B6
MMKTVAILGCGTRGMIYARELGKYPQISVTAVCDTVEEKARQARLLSGGSAEIFTAEEEFFAEGRRADVLVIATQDRDHYRHAMRALEQGYQLLLEKPLSPSEEECFAIGRKAREVGALVLVCHVLRYTDFYKTVAGIVHSGRLGRIININHTENVGYWHFAHSFVRGPWRNETESCPLVLAKCCHDLDLLYWLIGCDCTRVTSFGATTVFCAGAAPQGSAAYCLQGCEVKGSCPFDAEKIYLLPRATGAAPVLGDAGLQVVGKPGCTAQELREALKSGPYGRCVYRCDNDVCDHQVVNMEWANGATSSLTITPFTKDCYRRISISGTQGELFAADSGHEITVNTFLGDRTEMVTVDDHADQGHLGGDVGIVRTLVDILEGKKVDPDYFTTIDITLKSHAIAFAAERARQRGCSIVPSIF